LIQTLYHNLVVVMMCRWQILDSHLNDSISNIWIKTMEDPGRLGVLK
jgi:hypothetical protein